MLPLSICVGPGPHYTVAFPLCSYTGCISMAPLPTTSDTIPIYQEAARSANESCRHVCFISIVPCRQHHISSKHPRVLTAEGYIGLGDEYNEPYMPLTALYTESDHARGEYSLAEPSLVVEKHSELIARQCPECKFGIEQGQEVVPCPVCKSPHHIDCWYDAGGCGKVGCRGVATARPTHVQSTLSSASRQRQAGGGGADAAAEQPVKKSAAGTIVTAVAVLAIVWLLWYAIFR